MNCTKSKLQCGAAAAVQGVVRPGLLSLRERYRLRGRELAEDGLVLREQLDAAREANGEWLEELAALKRQVRCYGVIWEIRACSLDLVAWSIGEVATHMQIACNRHAYCGLTVCMPAAGLYARCLLMLYLLAAGQCC
jgi:hypothetical protein